MSTILIIEDHPQILRSLSTILEMEGFRVVSATNGAEGIEAAKKEKPDLILCDVMMPVKDGFATLAELRKTPGFELVPFIFLTARAERADQRAGMTLGADDYLTKPIVREDLLNAVRTRLERHALHSQQASSGSGFAPDYSSPEPLVKKLGLTEREADVLLWVAQGKSNADVATILGMAEKTVKKHMTHIFEKLGLEGRNAATVAALEALSASPKK